MAFDKMHANYIQSANRKFRSHPLVGRKVRTVQARVCGDVGPGLGQTGSSQDKSSASKQITIKNLLPIVIADIIWGYSWHGHQVHC